MGASQLLPRNTVNPLQTFERRIIRPVEGLTVSEWATRNRRLTPKTSAIPGPWKNETAPYLVQPMDELCSDIVEELDLCTATQVGKTELEINQYCYCLDQDQGPALFVYPTVDLAEYTAKHRIKEAIQNARSFREDPEIGERVNENKILEYSLRGMITTFVGANSATNLSSRPIRYLWFDEVDKFPDFLSKEANPLKLAWERTKTFWNRFVVKVSSPTVPEGAIWSSLQTCDIVFTYHVPCPHCGGYQPLVFDQVKFGEERDPEKVEAVAHYECAKCREIIRDSQKPQMLLAGKWTPTKLTDRAPVPRSRAKKVGYHLSSLYSSFVTFGQVAREFVECKDYPELLRNFVNGWLAMPWVEKQDRIDIRDLLDSTSYQEARVPGGVEFLTSGVDVHKGHLHITVRGWTIDTLESWLVYHERLDIPDGVSIVDIQDLDALMEMDFASIADDNLLFPISILCFDSGYRTNEVYSFCRKYPDRARPVKGSSTRMRTPYSVTMIDKKKAGRHRQVMGGLQLYMVDTVHFKNTLDSRRRQKEGTSGKWHLPHNASTEYLDQIGGETKVAERDRKTGVVREEWKPKKGCQNHYLDAEVYAFVAAEIALEEEFILPPVKTNAPSLRPPNRKHMKDDIFGGGIRGNRQRRSGGMFPSAKDYWGR